MFRQHGAGTACFEALAEASRCRMRVAPSQAGGLTTHLRVHEVIPRSNDRGSVPCDANIRHPSGRQRTGTLEVRSGNLAIVSGTLGFQ